MSHTLVVQVVDSDDRPVVGTAVVIDIEGILSGGRLTESTDNSGHAEFETAEDYPSYRELMIYVRGQSFGPYDIGGGSYTVQLE